MDIKVIEEQGSALLALGGDVDLSCSPEARKAILETLDDGKNLLINLSEVTYIDSSGVASLVEGYQMAKKMKLEFALISVSEAVMNVLQLARLDSVFPIYATLEDYRQTTG
ncbi:MAG: STAS domain-containing protein [Gammaproteobacteria bacterium]